MWNRQVLFLLSVAASSTPRGRARPLSTMPKIKGLFPSCCGPGMPGPYGFSFSKIRLDLELILLSGLFHLQMLVVEVKLHGLAVIGVAGQAQQLIHTLLLLFRVE